MHRANGIIVAQQILLEAPLCDVRLDSSGITARSQEGRSAVVMRGFKAEPDLGADSVGQSLLVQADASCDSR